MMTSSSQLLHQNGCDCLKVELDLFKSTLVCRAVHSWCKLDMHSHSTYKIENTVSDQALYNDAKRCIINQKRMFKFIVFLFVLPLKNH